MKACLDGENRIVGDVIRYIPDLPIETAFEEVGRTRFDYIVSRSVLEHVSDIDETYASCRTLIEDGGLMIHKVDLSNHSTIELHPLQFLTYSQRLWGAMSSNISRVNRARWPQHRVSIERNRFTIERFVATRLLEIAQVRSIRPQLRSPFREMTDEELRIYGFYMACRAV
jgi:cyclopropane fatty-acyl-phospholipid synthase-like methyltransferase